MDKAPWEYHPDLVEDRLKHIAEILVQVRRETIELYDEAGGDTPWSLACRAYDRSRTHIIRESFNLPWLSLIDDSLHLVFQIGSVPVRFYRGAATNPKANTLSCCYPELSQLTMAFNTEEPDLLWRFAVETNEIGDVIRVAFIGTDESANIYCQWTAPEFESAKVINIIRETGRPTGVELSAPTVAVKQGSKSKGIVQDDGQ